MKGILKDILKECWLWVILLAWLILWLSSCTPTPLEPNLKLLTARKGTHDFKPSPLPVPGEARSIEGFAKFYPSCWYDNLGEDNADWNKMIGVYRWADVYKNKNSVIIGWRPDIKIRDVFELCMYENIEGRNHPQEWAIYKVRAGETFHFHLEEINGKYTLYINSNRVASQRSDRVYRIVGIAGTWFGGNRKTPWDMHIGLIY